MISGTLNAVMRPVWCSRTLPARMPRRRIPGASPARPPRPVDSALVLLAAASAAFVAAVIQRITGLGFVLVLIGPVVLLYGGREGVTLGVLLALVVLSGRRSAVLDPA